MPPRLQRRQALSDALETRVLCMDGAMGTMLQDARLTPADFGGPALDGCNENLVRTRPDVILGIHRAYLQAGADIIETDTFGSTSIVLAEYGLAHRAREISRRAAELARQAADEIATSLKPRWVAGSMGPTTKAISVTGGVTFDALREAYYEQAAGLIEGGADILLLETCQDTRNVKAGLLAIARLRREIGVEIPVMVSCTIEPTGTMLAGQTADAFYVSIAHAGLLSIGLNCATGPEFMTDHIRTLNEIASTRISCYPNAGLPNAEGQYDETPQSLAREIERFVDRRLAQHRRRLLRHHARPHRRASRRWSRARSRARRSRPLAASSTPASNWSRPRTPTARSSSASAPTSSARAPSRTSSPRRNGRKPPRSPAARSSNGAHIVDVCLQSTDRDELDDIPPFYDKLIRKIKAPVMIDTTDPRAIELRPHVLPGQEHHQLRQPRRRRGEVRARLPAGPRLRRGAHRRLDRRGQARRPRPSPASASWPWPSAPSAC